MANNPHYPTASNHQDTSIGKPVVGEFTSNNGREAAAKMIRGHLDDLYADEPSAKDELQAAKTIRPSQPRSKHQHFMQQLSNSGKTLVQIQTEWHSYYTSLPDDEKHAVWQEFYTNHGQTELLQPKPTKIENDPKESEKVLPPPRTDEEAVSVKHAQAPINAAKLHRQARTAKRKIRKAIEHPLPKSKARQGFESLLFGVLCGVVVLVIVMFSFFNEVVIAPLIQPSRTASATPVIFDTDTVAASATPQVVIPKINVQIPVDYTQTSNDEEIIQTALESGVVHYPSTVKPGEQGNTAIFGHSSNNIFNKGKYKFAFVLLKEMQTGDVFYLTYNSKVYAYKVFDKRVVAPTEISVLNPVAGKAATATLITCDPPGTSLNRLVVWGEQISPEPSGNAAVAAPSSDSTQPAELASNGPTLWSRVMDGINPFN